MRNEIIKIYKTQIHKLNLSQKEVLSSNTKIKERKNLLKAAVIKRKDGDGKVNITIQTEDRGDFKIYSAVLMAGKDFVELKGGNYLPIRCIKKVSI